METDIQKIIEHFARVEQLKKSTKLENILADCSAFDAFSQPFDTTDSILLQLMDTLDDDNKYFREYIAENGSSGELFSLMPAARSLLEYAEKEFKGEEIKDMPVMAPGDFCRMMHARLGNVLDKVRANCKEGIAASKKFHRELKQMYYIFNSEMAGTGLDPQVKVLGSMAIASSLLHYRAPFETYDLMLKRAGEIEALVDKPTAENSLRLGDFLRQGWNKVDNLPAAIIMVHKIAYEQHNKKYKIILNAVQRSNAIDFGSDSTEGMVEPAQCRPTPRYEMVTRELNGGLSEPRAEIVDRFVGENLPNTGYTNKELRALRDAIAGLKENVNLKDDKNGLTDGQFGQFLDGIYTAYAKKGAVPTARSLQVLYESVRKEK